VHVRRIIEDGNEERLPDRLHDARAVGYDRIDEPRRWHEPEIQVRVLVGRSVRMRPVHERRHDALITPRRLHEPFDEPLRVRTLHLAQSPPVVKETWPAVDADRWLRAGARQEGNAPSTAAGFSCGADSGP